MIILKDIEKIYSAGLNKKALSDFSVEIEDGEFFCLVGTSGSGKSTVLKLIAKLELPTKGEVTAPDNVGMVFQLGALFPWMNTEENISFGPRMKNEPRHRIHELTHKYIEMVGLKEFEKKYPRELSGGQRQRVGIARALAIEPEALLLDEPFSSLDPLTTDELHKDLLDIWRETGKTIVMVSHSLEEAVFLADRVAVLKDGRLTGINRIEFQRPRNEKKEEFMEEVEKIKGLMQRD